MTTIIRNNYHNTEYRTQRTLAEVRAILSTHPDRRSGADRAFVRRCRLVLCGAKGCACAHDELGARGPRAYRQYHPMGGIIVAEEGVER